ncbi:MAG: PAS domain S-box protein [Candidatus Kapaibacterium sp.]|nr:MAG: PAS domain S-box protein [Candidatus Kapabacteria bacterium]
MKYMKKFLFFLLFVFVVIHVQAGKALAQAAASTYRWQPDYVFEHISQEQGLSFNTVTAFVQDKQGFLWVGTFDGLNRYDGVQFKVFRHTAGDVTKNIPNQIRLLYADRNDEIWIVSFDNTITRFNPRTERFSPVRFLEHSSGQKDSSPYIVGGITEDAAGTLWISTLHNVYRLNRTAQAFEPFPRKYFPPSQNIIFNGTLLASTDKTLPSAKPRLWTRIHGGLAEIDTDTDDIDTASVAPASAAQSQSRIRTYLLTDTAFDKAAFFGGLVQDSSGYIWFSDNAHIFCFDARSKAVIARFPRETYLRLSPLKNPPPQDFRFRAALCAPDGTVWFGTGYAGIVVVRYDREPRNASITLLNNDEANPLSLSGNTIRAFFADKSGVVWVGGEPFGINKYSPSQQKFQLFRHSALRPNTLANNYVRGICQTNDGTIWVATQFGGLCRYNPTTRIWTRFQDDITEAIPVQHRLKTNRFWSVFADRTGTVWAGTLGNGLLRYNPQRDRFEQSPLVPDSTVVQVITEDRAGNLLIGTRANTSHTGLFVLPADRKHSSVRFFPTKNPRSSDIMSGDVVAIHQDRLGTVWLGGLRELWMFDEKFDTKNAALRDRTPDMLRASGMAQSVVGSIVTAIMEDRTGTLWIASKGAGLAQYDRAHDRFSFINQTHGLPDNSLYAALEDGQGRFWISSDAGLTLWNRQHNTFRTFTSADGLQGREFNRGSYYKSANGTMFFGGTNGFNAFHPDSLRFNNAPPAIALTGIQIFAENMSPESIITRSKKNTTAQNESEQGSEQGTITLRHDQNFLTFHFAALDFHIPENNQYSYQLEGLDKQWIMGGTRNEAVYTSLDPGKYTFRVRAANNDGVWNDAGLQLHVVILPPWWQTWWFRTILILSGLGAIALVMQNYRRRIQRLQEHRRELLLHIEERQRAELEMQRSEEKFRALFETSTLGMVLWQNDGVILEVNAAFMRLLGHERHEVSALNFWQILGNTHSSSITHSLKQRRAFGPIEQTLVQSNDEKIAVVMYGIAIGNHSDNQDFERVWSVIEDITERKRATDALLRYQLNPHFMFNVLNSVNALMVENQRNAKRMIIQFSSLLRHTLVASTRQTAPLGDEIEAVEHYLAIEKIRFEERLEAVVNADRATLRLNVPVFLVQPLVENAIKYGMQDAQTTLHISVSSRIENEELCIEVANTGVWVTSNDAALAKKRSTGIGLTNLRKRLEQYYAQSHSMTISEEQGMVRIRITIALKELSQTMENVRVSS